MRESGTGFLVPASAPRSPARSCLQANDRSHRTIRRRPWYALPALATMPSKTEDHTNDGAESCTTSFIATDRQPDRDSETRVVYGGGGGSCGVMYSRCAVAVRAKLIGSDQPGFMQHQQPLCTDYGPHYTSTTAQARSYQQPLSVRHQEAQHVRPACSWYARILTLQARI